MSQSMLLLLPPSTLSDSHSIEEDIALLSLRPVRDQLDISNVVELGPHAADVLALDGFGHTVLGLPHHHDKTQ